MASGSANLLFPPRAENSYRGQKGALIIFGILLVIRSGISLGSIFNGHQAASAADGIPLDSYTAAGAQTVLSLVALVGLYNFSICCIGALMLVRYRNLISLMYCVFLLQQFGRHLILQFLPIVRVGTPPGTAINRAILGLMILGLLLSLWRRDVTQQTGHSGDSQG